MEYAIQVIISNYQNYAMIQGEQTCSTEESLAEKQKHQ